MKIVMSEKSREKLVIRGIGLTLCLFMVMLFITNGGVISTVLFPDARDNYMDFFNSLNDANAADPYTEKGAIYPPLCYLIYRVFDRMIRPSDCVSIHSFYMNYMDGVAVYSDATGQGWMHPFYNRDSLSGMAAFGIFMGLSVAMLAYFTYQYAKRQKISDNKVALALMVSAPTLFAVQRGNSIVLATACLMAFLCCKDDKNGRQRQFGYVMLAVAANLKIYPAIFGLLLVSEKRWRDCLCCIAYGCALFFIPMMFFGGLSNVQVMIDNIFKTSVGFNDRFGTRVDVGCFLSFLSAKGWGASLLSVADKALYWGSGLFLLCYFCQKEEWQRMVCLFGICVFVPGFSYMYNLIYLIPLVIVLLKHGSKASFLITLLCFLFYPFDISQLSLFAVEGAYLNVRLWDLIAMLCGIALMGYMLFQACKGLRDGVTPARKK